MINSNSFIGLPVEFENICLIYPPKVKEVAAIKNFWYKYKILTTSQEEIDEKLSKEEQVTNFPTPFEILINNAKASGEYCEAVEDAIFIFTHQKGTVLCDEKKIVIGDVQKFLDGKSSFSYITAENFFNFQNSIRQSLGFKPEVDLEEEKKLHPKIRRMRAKARLRDRIKQKQNNKNGLRFESSLVAICCMGLGITPLSIGEMSYAAVDALMQVYQAKIRYELDTDILLAGGDRKKIKPEFWIKNFDD